MNEVLYGVSGLGILRQIATATVFPAFLVRRLLVDAPRHDGGTPEMKVSEIMTTDVRACLADESTSAAVRIMWDCDCGIVPVVDASARVIGAITDRDICIACWSRDAKPGELLVADVMTRDVQCCRPEDTIAAAESAIRSCQVRRLPVVDAEGQLRGIISLADITREAEKQLGDAVKNDIRAEEIVEAVAAVSQPRVEIAAASLAARSSAQTRTTQQRPVE